MKINQMEPTYGKEEKEAIVKYLDSGAWLMEHKQTHMLEKMMCDITGAKYSVAVPNGTLTLIAGLKALGVKPGDEVIVPDYTIIASATCASFIGAKPVFVDVEDKTYGIDVNHLKQRITDKTKAVVLVSINGRPPAHWDSILSVCDKKNIPILEDSAQSLGSYYNGGVSKVHIGRLGLIGSFSFSVSKIVTMGNGGILVTDDKEIFEELCFMKNFGRLKGGMDRNYYPGIDLKFNDVLATIGIEQLKKLSDRINRKKVMYKLYENKLKNVDKIEFIKTDLKYTSPWMNDILLPNSEVREKLINHLSEKGIGSRKFYPAIHTQEPFASDTRFYNSTKVSKRGLWLPSSLKLTNNQIMNICNEIKNCLE